MQKFVTIHPLFLIIEFLLIFGNLKEIKSDLVKNDQLQAIHESHQHHNLKFSNKGMKLNKYERKGREIDEQEEFAIMYKDLLPVGIIQGSAGNYELLPVHENEAISLEIDPINIKSETRRRDTNFAAEAEFADEKYPYIFAKFKVDSKMEKGIKNQKREALKSSSILTSNNNDDNNKLKFALNQFENNDAGAENALKGVLNEMGLIDDDNNNNNNKEIIDKRNVELIEDEDLEHGTNKINLIKIDDESSSSEEEKSRIKLEISTENYEIIQYPEPKSLIIKNDEKIVNNNNEKHSEEFKESDDDNNNNNKERDKRSKEFEQEIEQQIKEKLNKIKEEVKNEFDQLNNNNNNNNNKDEENDDDDEKTQRKKRNIILGNLMEFESKNKNNLINPINVAEENNNLVPHIRRRRSENSADQKETLKFDLLMNPINNEERKFQLRNLKSIISVEKRSRNKKSSCKCSSGKNCKCEKEKKSQHYYEDGKFRLNIHPNAYRISENSKFIENRRKRNDFLNLVEIHGGAPILEHLLKIRERNLRNKRSLINTNNNNNNNNEQLTLNNIVQEDIFGALPQNFDDGESLARFKRI